MQLKDLIYLAIFFLFNIGLKFLYLDSMPIAMDEPFSIYVAQMDIKSIVQHLAPGNNPPLFEIILHHWIKVFGIHPGSVRILPMIFSSLTAVFIYLIGIRNFNRMIAILAVALFTFSNYQIYFSHEARVYSLFALLTAISMFSFLELLRNPKNRLSLIILLLSNALIIYAHFFGFFILMIQALSIILFKGVRNKLIKNYAIASAGVFILYTPYLKYFLIRFFDSSSNGTWVQKPGWDAPYFMLWQFTNAPITAVLAILVLLTGATLLFTKEKWRNIPDTSKIIGTWFLFPFFFMFLVSFRVPMFLDRYLIHASIGFYIFLAITISYVSKVLLKKKFSDYKKFNPAYVLAFAVLLPVIATCNPDIDNKRQVIPVIEHIRNFKDHETAVVVCPSEFDLNFTYYYSPEVFKNCDNKHFNLKLHQALAKENIFFVSNLQQLDTAKLNRMNRIILLDAGADFLQNEKNILSALSKNKSIAETTAIPEIFKIYRLEKQ